MFADKSLPPLSPVPPGDSDPNIVLMDELDISSFPWEASFYHGNSHPPCKGHHRSNSDFPLGEFCSSSLQYAEASNQGTFRKIGDLREIFGNDEFIQVKNQEMDISFDNSSGGKFFNVKSDVEIPDDFFNSLIDMNNPYAMNLTEGYDFDNGDAMRRAKFSGDDANDRSHSANVLRLPISPAEGIKRSASDDITPPGRHRRSLSVDSAMMKYDINQLDCLSTSNSQSDNAFKVNLIFGNGDFNDIQLKQIVKDEKLAEIAMSNPKLAKRILANRQSAARSKERKNMYISELKHKVEKLQIEASTLSAQVTILEKEYADVTCQNSELRFRFQAKEQQSKLRDALHSALTAEVQRLKLGNMELRDDTRMKNGLGQEIPLKHAGF